MKTGSTKNLWAIWHSADAQDLRDGREAYGIYNKVIREFADHYGVTFERALSAFVALSPNSDYFGNLRSLASVLAGIRDGRECSSVVVSTYNHCRDRAWLYATGQQLFLASAKGPKIRSFFLNIFDPADPIPVTIDGHMVCAWSGIDAPMKDSFVSSTQYRTISVAVRRVAYKVGLVPNQVQATLWMTRKRIKRIKFASQLDFFSHPIMVTPDEARPYPATKRG